VYRPRSRFFFFQAEDGIRDYKVTGVQTCALPISPAAVVRSPPTTTSPLGRRTSAKTEPTRPTPKGDHAAPFQRARRATGAPPAGDRERGGEGKRGELRGRRII